ncbi:SGNH/GDSL hydrolase family protein [Actinacidiphila yeochonensis]|uniref:SGNH/GDSL hydrolase family protein n=1 Tax=Actinacidiphila yeochonensis TaxID=89050 RepID=UPI00069143B9|nr:SGNH/GDSL hydrolase family protein [Actinacidiphila yeochonensis]
MAGTPDLTDEPGAHGASPSGTPSFGSYAAVGDSFTEGVGDPGPNGLYVGWADRLAAVLAGQAPPGGFHYANLAVRGRLLDQIIAEQVPLAARFAPDLVTFCAGGNDILRPGSDPDDLAARFEAAVASLRRHVGTVVVSTGFDTRGVPVLGLLRGKIATYNGHIRAIADRYQCPVLDLWSLRSLRDPRAWSEDRLHLSAEGHTRVARLAAQALGLPGQADPDTPFPPRPRRLPAQVRRENVRWAREYLAPWVGRRLRGRSSGDTVLAKRPALLPFTGLDTDAAGAAKRAG